MPDEAPHYTGHLEHIEGDYRGRITDDAGFYIELRAEIEYVGKHRRFRLFGMRCAPPDWLRIPIIDDEAPDE